MAAEQTQAASSLHQAVSDKQAQAEDHQLEDEDYTAYKLSSSM